MGKSEIKYSLFLSLQNSTLLDDGSLLITLCPMKTECLKITSWKAGCKTFFSKTGIDNSDFKAVKPPPINLITIPHKCKRLPVYQYFRGVPDEVIKNIEQFLYMQIEMLQVCSRSAYALDLLKTNSILLWLWVSKNKKHLTQFSEGELNIIMGKNQRNLLSEVLEIDVLPYEVKLIKKIVVFEGNEEEVEMIHRAFSSGENLKMLQHFEIIPVIVLGLATGNNVFPFISRLYNLFNRSSSIFIMKKYIQETLHLIIHINDMTSGGARDRLMKCRSRKQLEQLHDRVLAEYTHEINTTQCENKERLFPLPPIADKPLFIEAIRSQKDLEQETLEMNHCIASLSHLLENGDNYFYRILKPQRASLHIRYYYEQKKYQLEECRLFNNQEPSDDTIDMIYDWLDKGNIGLKRSIQYE